VLAEGDLVTVLATYTGTHRRTFMGVPATDTGVTGRIAFAYRISGGRIRETWTEIEPWGLLQQLGVPFRGGETEAAR
jgi:predicted ester cyclase